ncbi:MAG: hypothetical protein KKI12_09935 [Proteobacteria bacterium]|nr:hypothetical protein [Pseudomonadota bacterium]MBU4260170.1 hypothetical protein [Pseudomonadota bacterium]MBU4288474.1 hypothetical protein [Pseudomonadota bacterium]MCG2759181.1 hypothetical protein [Desulfobacteraceae bacterium]
MTKKTCIGRRIEKISALVVVSFVFMLLKPNVGIPYEREIVLEEKYLSESEKESLKDNFEIDLALGYGFSYTQAVIGAYGLDPKGKSYYNELDLEYSENLAALRLTATFVINPKTGVYFGIPFGIIEAEGKDVWDDDDIRFSIGDLFAGVYHHLLPETESWPNVTANLALSTDLAQYSSLGNGVWDVTLGISARKFLSERFYLSGVCDYTYTKRKHNVDPGDKIGYGGGIGYFTKKGTMIEARLKGCYIGAAEIPWSRETVLEKEQDLIFTLGVKSWLPKRACWSLTWGGLDEGVEFKRNYFGFECSVPIF